MALSSHNMKLATQIEETARNLAALPTEVDELLPILERAVVLLSQVDQAPIASQELLDACSLVMKELLKEPLMKHTDNDVQAFLASCLCEVTRIMAPEQPYEDGEMKEIFQLIVSTFKDLSDMSSRSYSQRISILDSVARVRSAVIMLDLECYSLIAEMFGHFLGSIRDYHPQGIFIYMESIMTLVIEESDDVSLELLTPILSVLKKDNEEAQTIARKLGEKVLETCTLKVKPYLSQAVKFLGGPLSQYSAIVANICEESGVVEHCDNDGSMNQLNKADPIDETTHIPVNIESDGTTSGDSETKPLIKLMAKRLSGKKWKKPEAEIVKKKKENCTSHQSSEEEEETLSNYLRKGKMGDERTSKRKKNIDNAKEEKASLKRKKRMTESLQADAELLKQSPKRHKADIKKNCAEIISSKFGSKSVKDKKRTTGVIIGRKQITAGTYDDKLYLEFGENLVDSKIKVWWEDDHEFYEGVIASFDPDNKKHKVLYDDGDIEFLNLKNERWEIVYDGTVKDKHGNKEPNEVVSDERSSRSKVKKHGGKSPHNDDISIMPKSKSKSSKGKTLQIGSKSSDGKGKKR